MSQVFPKRRSTPGRWEPVSEFEQTDRMRRVLEQTFGGFAGPSFLTEDGEWSPLVDVEETDVGHVIEAELPGVKQRT
jgi:HSP20 family molecular chaperone IbpA